MADLTKPLAENRYEMIRHSTSGGMKIVLKTT
jgi:hypothetical protein